MRARESVLATSQEEMVVDLRHPDVRRHGVNWELVTAIILAAFIVGSVIYIIFPLDRPVRDDRTKDEKNGKRKR